MENINNNKYLELNNVIRIQGQKGKIKNLYFLHYQKIEISTNKKYADFSKKAKILTRHFLIDQYSFDNKLKQF